MLTIVVLLGVIFSVVCIILQVTVFSNSSYVFKQKLDNAIIIVFLITIINAILTLVLQNLTYEERVQTQRYDSVAQIVYDIVGEKEIYSFFFYDGSEIIQIEDQYYTVPRVNMRSIDAQNTKIYEQDIDKRFVVEYTVYTKNKLSNIWQDILLFGLGCDTTEKKIYEVYVPIGTSQYIYQNEQSQS